VVTPAELRARARAIRLVVSDVDGVLTDAGVWYSARGEELLRFSRRDGAGVERLARAGIGTALLSREDSDIVRARARKLGLEHVLLGVREKIAALATLEERTGIERNSMAFIGDDLFDVDVLRAVALSGAPSDAVDEVRAIVHHVTRAPGGQGAFRQFADWIMTQRGEECSG
jgi:3-deoxy-D-manno-octulosonate 8-phosphate phosphatase (KDO 8-P phosphatase)